jgi:hypothetical protein
MMCRSTHLSPLPRARHRPRPHPFRHQRHRLHRRHPNRRLRRASSLSFSGKRAASRSLVPLLKVHRRRPKPNRNRPRRSPRNPWPNRRNPASSRARSAAWQVSRHPRLSPLANRASSRVSSAPSPLARRRCHHRPRHHPLRHRRFRRPPLRLRQCRCHHGPRCRRPRLHSRRRCHHRRRCHRPRFDWHKSRANCRRHHRPLRRQKREDSPSCFRLSGRTRFRIGPSILQNLHHPVATSRGSSGRKQRHHPRQDGVRYRRPRLSILVRHQPSVRQRLRCRVAPQRPDAPFRTTITSSGSVQRRLHPLRPPSRRPFPRPGLDRPSSQRSARHRR